MMSSKYAASILEFLALHHPRAYQTRIRTIIIFQIMNYQTTILDSFQLQFSKALIKHLAKLQVPQARMHLDSILAR